MNIEEEIFISKLWDKYKDYYIKHGISYELLMKWHEGDSLEENLHIKEEDDEKLFNSL